MKDFESSLLVPPYSILNIISTGSHLLGGMRRNSKIMTLPDKEEKPNEMNHKLTGIQRMKSFINKKQSNSNQDNNRGYFDPQEDTNTTNLQGLIDHDEHSVCFD